MTETSTAQLSTGPTDADPPVAGALDPTVFFRSGDVVRYRSERDNRWCREGMAIAEERSEGIALFDTYWQCGDQHELTTAERCTAVLIFNLADYDELPASQRYQWEKYAEDDRKAISSQHGLCWRYFVRKGAEESLPTQIENARERVREAESKVDTALSTLKWELRQLAELQAREVPDGA